MRFYTIALSLAVAATAAPLTIPQRGSSTGSTSGLGSYIIGSQRPGYAPNQPAKPNTGAPAWTAPPYPNQAGQPQTYPLPNQPSQPQPYPYINTPGPAQTQPYPSQPYSAKPGSNQPFSNQPFPNQPYPANQQQGAPRGPGWKRVVSPES